MLEHEMAFSSPPQSTSYQYGVQGFPGICFNCQQEQYESIHVGGFPIPTYRMSPGETALQNSSLPSKTRAGTAMPDTGFNTRCMRHCGNPSGLLNFCAGSTPLLPPTNAPYVHDEQKQRGDDDSTWMPLHAARDGFSSMFDTQIRSELDETMQSRLYGLLDLDDIGAWNPQFWIPVEGVLLLNHAVTEPEPLSMSNSHANHMHFFDEGMLEIPQWASEPSTSLDTSMQEQVLNVATGRNVPLYDLCSPFQNSEPWDESLLQDMEDILLPTFPSNGHFNHTSHNTSNPFGTDSDLYATPVPIQPSKSLKLRDLIPKPPILPTDVLSGIDSDEIEEGESSLRGRRRCLTPEEAKAAAWIRKIGSCARCIIRKIKCTDGVVCEPCQLWNSRHTLQHAPNCPRGSLTQYQDAFLAPIVFAHLDQLGMKTFLRKVEFINEKTHVRLSLGSSYPVITITLSTFRTADEKFSHVQDVTSTLNDDKQSFAMIATSHLGVQPSSADQLEQTCADYLEMMNEDQISRICSSRITNRVINAARRFQRMNTFANQDVLLRNAIQIAEIYLLMGKRFLFTRESSIDNSESSTTPPRESSKLLNRQIKSVFHHMLRGMIPEALKNLDGRLRNQEKRTWASSLLTHLLFCLCVEQIQVAIDASIFAKIPIEGADHVYTRKQGRDICRSLEQQTLGHTWLFVEGILKGITNNYDPFKIGAQMDDDSDMNKAEKNLVADIRQIVFDYEEEVATRAEDTYCGGWSYLTSDWKRFKVRNSARLVSKVLQKLCR